ncbi:MAG: hypothetical protein K2N38_01010 [Oscillospiraceae bacterium]|nr:hypothetical protein [Oscillospiraceae bacterium]
MKTYTIIGGVNGVGKSSICGVLKGMDEKLGVVIDPDKIITKFDGDKLKSGKEAVRIINDCLEKGESFTQETTLSGQKTLKTILAAREKGYLIVLHYIALNSAEECLSRIKNRVSKGGHDIPETDVQRRFDKRLDDVLRVLPHCDFAFFWDNEKGFNQVACYANGEFAIIKKDENLPGWILSLKETWEKRK